MRPVDNVRVENTVATMIQDRQQIEDAKRGENDLVRAVEHGQSDHLSDLRYQPISHEWLNEYFTKGRGWDQVLFVASAFKEDAESNYLWVSDSAYSRLLGYVALSKHRTGSVEFYIGETPIRYRVIEAGTYG